MVLGVQARNDLIVLSGIVEGAVQVVALQSDRGDLHLMMKCSFMNELKIDQSMVYNGVYLTVASMMEDTYTVTAIKEALGRSNFRDPKVGDKMSLERSVLMSGRLDGHITQGHVDQTAVYTEVKEAGGSWYYAFEYTFDKEITRQGYMTVEKGSVCVNGASLTICNSQQSSFQVAVTPYTHDNTNFYQIEKGTVMNLKFGIVGKYTSKIMQFKQGPKNFPSIKGFSGV